MGLPGQAFSVMAKIDEKSSRLSSKSQIDPWPISWYYLGARLFGRDERMKTTYEAAIGPLRGDPVWRIQDRDLAMTDGGRSLMTAFLDEYPHEDYKLSIYDTNTYESIEIDCDVSDIASIVSQVYCVEDATPLSFVCVNSVTKAYEVGMALSKNRFRFGHYGCLGGQLEWLGYAL